MAAPDGSDGELLTGPGLPRWVVPLLVVASVGLLVAFVLAKVRDGDSSASSRATAGATTSAAVDASGDPTPIIPSEFGVGPSEFSPVRLPVNGAPVFSLATDGRSLWALQPDLLLHRVGATVDTVDVPAGAGAQLVLDTTGGFVWVMSSGDHPEVTWFEANSLEPVGSLRWPRPIARIATLGGGLYVADSLGVSLISVGGGVQDVARLDGESVVDLTADLVGKRLIILTPLDVLTLDSGGLTSTGGPPAAITRGMIRVTGSGLLWLTGSGSTVPVLTRLDPRALTPSNVATAQNLLGFGTPVLAAGVHDVLVASAAGNIWCVDGTFGLTREQWHVRARHLTVSGRLAFAATAHGLVQLDMDPSCRG